MKKINSLFILLTLSLICLLPTGVQALAQLDDSSYNVLFNGAAPVNYNKGAVLIYRGWSQNYALGYKTEMIKAIPHMNIINLTGQTLSFTEATGCFPSNIVGQVALMREITQPGTPNQFSYSFDLKGTGSNGYIGSDDYNNSAGPNGGGTAMGDGEWNSSLNKVGASDLQMSIGSNSFGLHVDWGSNYNGLEVSNANLVTMSLRDINANKYASSVVNNGVINRGMVYLTGYTDSRGNAYEVILVAGDRTAITLLVKYVNS